jgi:hypothetical protein
MLLLSLFEFFSIFSTHSDQGRNPLLAAQEGILELMYRAGRKGAAVPDAPHFSAEVLSPFFDLP